MSKFAPFPGAVRIEPGSELWKNILGKMKTRDDSYAQTQIRRRKQEEEHEKFLKEYDAYLKQWRDSEGFDVDSVPDDLEGGPYVANDLEHCVPRYLESAYNCAKFAIEHQNGHKGSKTKLEFVELVKFNVDFSWEEEYYLTFRAKGGRDGSVSVYQALVTVPDPFLKEGNNEGKVEVLLFREKQT